MALTPETISDLDLLKSAMNSAYVALSREEVSWEWVAKSRLHAMHIRDRSYIILMCMDEDPHNKPAYLDLSMEAQEIAQRVEMRALHIQEKLEKKN